MKKGLILVILCALILSLATGCSAEEGSLRMEVEDIVASGNDQILTLNIQNNTGNTISYGWVGSCKFEVTTDQGSFFCDAPFMGKIPQGSFIEKINLYHCPGNIESIVITELCQLDDSELPGRELHDLTIYNRQKGISVFEDNFGFFDDPNWFTEIMTKLVPVFIVVVLVLKVVGSILGKKGNSVFTALANHNIPSSHDHAFEIANQQAIQMANDAHMREVDRQINENIQRQTQEAMDIGRLSVTPIEQGGFVPTFDPPTFEPPTFF